MMSSFGQPLLQVSAGFLFLSCSWRLDTTVPGTLENASDASALRAVARNPLDREVWQSISAEAKDLVGQPSEVLTCEQ